MLVVKDVHTYYGDSYALQGVSLEVKEGQIVALLGRNGMGKTTTIRSIIGFNPPRRGEILYKEKNIAGMRPFEVSRLGIGLVPQGRRIFPTLSVRENLTVERPQSKQGESVDAGARVRDVPDPQGAGQEPGDGAQRR